MKRVDNLACDCTPAGTKIIGDKRCAKHKFHPLTLAKIKWREFCANRHAANNVFPDRKIIRRRMSRAAAREIAIARLSQPLVGK